MQRNNNRESYQNLRKDYPVLFYKNYQYSITGNTISFCFEFKLTDELIFRPSASVSFPHFPQNREFILPIVENIIFQIGMIELVSYWKATCSPTIIIEAGSLSNEQVAWWKDLYFNGLGEFFYLNSLDVNEDSFVDIKSDGKVFTAANDLNLSDEYIVPVGGGKDSAVTLELLRQSGEKVHPLIMNPRGATIETVTAAGLSMLDAIVINRTIDPTLLLLNDRGFLNGHTPFSAMLAFYTLLASALSGYMHIALSNESSANEATIPGTTINHQYSKSLDFEEKFRNYYSKWISEDFNYFSFLRPLSELQIVSIFSKLENYHRVFKSCNAGSKTNSWCGNCPKCLFTHIMLSAYKGIEYADHVIGKEMLNNAGNIKDFDELTGFSAIKPFECVGTLDDVQTAMRMIIANRQNDPLPALAVRFRDLELNITPVISQPGETQRHFLTNYQLDIIKAAL
jgi:UDP-N-acetyl-alpha-D-muramoyl-L-alanyl-L-glutamate epimerase